MRLRLQFDGRGLVDERQSNITIGRAEDNDIVAKDHLISRRHARIEISRNKFVLIDQSTNGTFVQSSDDEESFVRRDSLQLKGQGMMARVPGEPDNARRCRERSAAINAGARPGRPVGVGMPCGGVLAVRMCTHQGFRGKWMTGFGSKCRLTA